MRLLLCFTFIAVDRRTRTRTTWLTGSCSSLSVCPLTSLYYSLTHSCMIETGLVTAGLALTLCLTWATMPYNEVWNGVLFVYTRSNANAVLVALNSRRANGAWSSGHSQSISTSHSASGASTFHTGVTPNAMNLSTISYTRNNQVEGLRSPISKDGIFVQTETIQESDKEYTLRSSSPTF